MSKKKKALIIVLVVLCVIVAALLAFFIYVKAAYGSKWYRNTTINGVNVSGKTKDESKKMILDAASHYTLTVKGRDSGEFKIDGDEINYTDSVSDDFDNVFSKQHSSVFNFFRNTTGNVLKSEYDSRLLKKAARNSVFVTGSDSYKITSPAAAYINFSNTKRRFEVAKEVEGNTIVKKQLVKAVTAAVDKAERSIDVSDGSKYPDMYVKPSVTSDDEGLKNEITAYNQAAIRFLYYDMGDGVRIRITPNRIRQWIRYRNGKIVYLDDKIGKWVENFCLKFKTVGKTRTYINHHGKKAALGGGDYGWQIDYYKTLDQVKKAIKKKINQKYIDAYIENPGPATRKKLAEKLDVLYYSEGEKRDYKNFVNDYDTSNYIEVDLGEQQVYVMKNGKVVYSCKCISGLPEGERKTRPGVWFIKEHQPKRTLVGDDYQTPVDWWTRITWTGTGFHAAPWKAWGSWSPNYYKTGGSHGCINLQTSDALKIYNLSKYREAVFIHY